MYTVKDIAEILNAEVRDVKKEDVIINDFDYIYSRANCRNCAFISISSNSWKSYLGKDSALKEGNELINKDTITSLIITERYVRGLTHRPSQIIVKNSIKAMKILGLFFRNHYTNPLIAITGSMGKSSTRMMLKKTLSDYTVLENRGNGNTRSAIWLQMCKLISNPDYALFEVSLNALNNRGNMSNILKPDIAIVTGIGSAHLSTISTTHEIAMFKSRIFEGLTERGTAIINSDTLHYEILVDKASKNTKKILSYGIKKDFASVEDIQIDYKKNYTDIYCRVDNHKINYRINAISDGMVLNSFAVLLTLKVLKLDYIKLLKYLADFNAFRRVLEPINIKTPNFKVTVIDDTHNASLPAMINSIQAFNSQCKYYSGRKIIALGQISDLGDQAENVHHQLIPYLEESEADYILCTDDIYHGVVKKVKNKEITWYKNMDTLQSDLLMLLNEDSLLLMKSSVTGTRFPSLAKNLPELLANNYYQLEDQDLYCEIRRVGKGFTAISRKDFKKIISFNDKHSETIEGLAPFLYFSLANDKNYTVNLRKWPTNNKEYFVNKEMKYSEVVDSMTNKPHPSLIYQLSYELFGKEAERQKKVSEYIRQLRLSPDALVNATGRFRKKERQKFTVGDLMTIYNEFGQNFMGVDQFVFGDIDNHGYISNDKIILYFTSFQTLQEAEILLQFITTNFIIE